MNKKIFAMVFVFMTALLMTGCVTRTIYGSKWLNEAESAFERAKAAYARGDYKNADSECNEARRLIAAARDIVEGPGLERGFLNWSKANKLDNEIIALEEKISEAQNIKQASQERESSRGYIELYSEVTGTVLLNGQKTNYTANKGTTVVIQTEPLNNRDEITYTVAVQDEKGTIFLSRGDSKVKLRQGGKVSAYVEDPLLPANPEDFDYQQNSKGTIDIKGYNGIRCNVIIPETIRGIKVTYVSFRGLHNRGNDRGSRSESYWLHSVVIPNSVTEIGSFSNQEYLHTVVLPNSITAIPEDAFSNCKSLKKIVIPNLVTAIGKKAFANSGLTSVTFGSRLDTIGEESFNGCQLTAVQLPASLKFIAHGAFYGNKITDLVIPGNVVWIQQYAFGNNPLVSLVIPQSLADINISAGFTFAFAAQKHGSPDSYPTSEFSIRNETLTRITIPANVNQNYHSPYKDNILESNFEQSFVNFYRSQGMKAGTYVKDGRIWTLR